MNRWERVVSWWESLNLKGWVNEHPVTIVTTSIVCVLIFLVVLISTLTGSEKVEIVEHKKEWYYDLNTGELFTAKIGQEVPVKAPSGPRPDGQAAGVRVYVFSYVDEPNESDRFVGFLEMPDPNSKLENNNTSLRGAYKWGYGKLIRRPSDEQWYPANSKQGQAILRKISLPDRTGRHARYCPPE